MSRQYNNNNNRSHRNRNQPARRHQRDYSTPSPPTNQRRRTTGSDSNVQTRRNLAGYAGPAGGTRLPRATFRVEQAIDSLNSFVLSDTELEQFKRRLVGDIRYGPPEQADNLRVRSKLHNEEIRSLKLALDSIKSDLDTVKEKLDSVVTQVDNQKQSTKNRVEGLQFGLHTRIDNLEQEVESTSRRILNNTESIEEIERQGVAQIFYSAIDQEISSLREEFEDKLQLSKEELVSKSDLDATNAAINANHTLLSTRIDSLVVPESVEESGAKGKEGSFGLEADRSDSESD